VVEVAAEAGGAALEPRDRLPARQLLEEVLDQVLLREPLDQLDLLDRHRGLVGDGAGEVDLRRPRRREQAEQLVVGDERDRDGGRAAAARHLGAELGEPDLCTGGRPPRGGCPEVELLASRVEQVEVAVLRP
jgi:hypothetical protein